MSFEIRTVTETEITAAGKIYTACSHAMNQKGLFNWTPEYPTQKEAERDQRAGALYGAFDGKVLMGVVTLDNTPAPEYATVSWGIQSGAALYIHRLAVHPSYQRRGLAKKLITFAEKQAQKMAASAVRIDSFSGNHRAVLTYEKLGFVKRGEIYYRNKDPRVRELPFYCFEKAI